MTVTRDAVAGTIPGHVEVTKSGTLRYTMKIETPPGRAGVEPDLEIEYASGAGDSVLGVGMTLGGVSTRTPCPSNPVQDGVLREVMYDAKDRWCLNGVREEELPLGQDADGRVTNFLDIKMPSGAVRA